MFKTELILLTANLISLMNATKMEGFIVGGKHASITKFPHSAYLEISCHAPPAPDERYGCGSSIINELVLLTAAHCLEDCLPIPKTKIVVTVGSQRKRRGRLHEALKFMIHPDYDPVNIINDIALVSVKTPIGFNSKVKRVVLMKRPPYFEEPAEVAGWGLVDEDLAIESQVLKSATQKVLSNQECKRILKALPAGTICADSQRFDESPGFAAQGDSGSALIVRSYIQIGLVSYKKPTENNSLVVYSDIGHFFDWIQSNIKKMICA